MSAEWPDVHQALRSTRVDGGAAEDRIARALVVLNQAPPLGGLAMARLRAILSGDSAVECFDALCGFDEYHRHGMRCTTGCRCELGEVTL